MKCSMSWAVVLGVLFTGGLAAEDKGADGKAGKAAGGAQQMQQKLLQQFDANKDGVLSDQEKLIASEMMRRAGAPPIALEPGGFPGSEQFVKQFDKNGDGKLSDAEKLAAQAAYQRMRGRSGGGPAYGIGFGGQAGGFAPNLPAAGAAGGAGGKVKEPKVSALVKRFDKDGDGKLNDEEKAAAQAELKNGKSKD